MKTKESTPNKRSAWVPTLAGAVRAAFGLVWAIDAYLKFQPAFQTGYLDILKTAATGQSPLILPWFNFWITLVTLNPPFFAFMTALIEAIVAAGLLLGLGRKWIYVLGAVFTLIIWSVPEAFGGPYSPGSTDVGAGLIYALMFVVMILLDSVLGRSPYSVDYYIERVYPNWRMVAEWGSTTALAEDPASISLSAQIPILIGIIVFLFVLFGLLTFGLNAASSGTGSLLPGIPMVFLH